MQSLAVVVMEPGSEWPDRVGRQDIDVVVLGQAPGEPDDALLRRVRQRVERGGDGLELAVLVCNTDQNEEAMDRRALVAHTLLGGVLRARHGHLVFSAPSDALPDLQQQLLGLTSTVLEGMAASSARVSVRFEGGRLRRDHPAVLA